MGLSYGTDVTGENALFKKMYDDSIRVQVAEETPIYDKLKAANVTIPAGGSGFTFAIQGTSYGAVSATVPASSGTYSGYTALPKPTQPTNTQGSADYVQVFGTAVSSLDTQMRTNKGNATAFAVALAYDLETMVKGTMRQFNRMIVGNAVTHVTSIGPTVTAGSSNITGVLGRVTATDAADTTKFGNGSTVGLVLADAAPNQFMSGQQLVVGNVYTADDASISTTGTGLSADRRVKVVNVTVSSSGVPTVTVQTQTGANFSNAAIGDNNIIAVGQNAQGATPSTTLSPVNGYNREIISLDIIGRNGTYGQTAAPGVDATNTLCGINPSTYPAYTGFENRNWTAANGNQPRQLTSGLLNTFLTTYAVRNLNQLPDVLLFSPMQLNAIQQAQTGVFQLQPVTNKGGGVDINAGGWTASTQTGKSKVIPYMMDSVCIDSTIYAITFDGLKKTEAMPFGLLSYGFEGGGTNFFPNPLFPTAQERYFGAMTQLVPVRRAAVGKLSDLEVNWDGWAWSM